VNSSLFDSLRPADFTADICDRDALMASCKKLAPKIRAEIPYDKGLFLYALTGVESAFGKMNVPRFERGYAPGGLYWKAQHLRDAYDKYGPLASCSYGPFQVMYIKAYELGFRAHPLYLWHPEFSGPYAVEVLNLAHHRGARTVNELLDAYNTGDHRDQNIPHGYFEKFESSLNFARVEWSE